MNKLLQTRMRETCFDIRLGFLAKFTIEVGREIDILFLSKLSFRVSLIKSETSQLQPFF